MDKLPPSQIVEEGKTGAVDPSQFDQELVGQIPLLEEKLRLLEKVHLIPQELMTMEVGI